MGFFDGFPFTNTHQLNLDWILQRIGKVDADSAAAAEAANNATAAANNANNAVVAVNRRVDEAIENSLTAAEQAAASAATANNVATEIRGIANGAAETANNAYNIASGIADTADQAFATAEEALSVVRGDTVYKDWSEVDTLYGNGTYAFNGINRTINGIYVVSGVMRIISYSNDYCTQILRTVSNASGAPTSYTLIRSRGLVGWDAWECPDPPMQEGVEYRTTERHNGKAVYKQAVNFGALPNANIKLVNPPAAIIGASIVGTQAYCINSTDGAERPLPFINYSGDVESSHTVNPTFNVIEVKTLSDLSAYNAAFKLSYTRD